MTKLLGVLDDLRTTVTGAGLQKTRGNEPLHGVLNAYSCIQYTFQIPNFKKAKQMVITELDWTANLRTGRFPQ